MKNQFIHLQKVILVSLAIQLLPIMSSAFVTVRATYTGVVSKDALGEACAGTTCENQAPDIIPLYGYGADIFVKIPLVPVGFGLRQEQLKLDVTELGITGEAHLSRTAVLVNYRFIESIVRFGLIGSYGVDHSAGLRVANGSSNFVDYTGGDLKSSSLGLEFEIKPIPLIPMIAGAEAGVINTTWDNAKDSVNSGQRNINLSGGYIKVFLGLDI